MVLAVAALCVPAAWWLVQRMGSRILPVTPPTEGISQTLATERAANISAVRYSLSLSIPPPGRSPCAARLAYVCDSPIARRSSLILRSRQSASPRFRPTAGRAPIQSEHGHLVIPGELLSRGENTVDIVFTAGDDALNRDDEYLYSLFVPARASQAFPCFDQPDIKGSLSLTLEIPAAWTALSNAPEIGRDSHG